MYFSFKVYFETPQQQEAIPTWAYGSRSFSEKLSAPVYTIYVEEEEQLTEKVKQALFAELSSLRLLEIALSVGLLPIVKDKTVEIWRWEPSSDWRDLFRFEVEGLNDRRQLYKAVATAPQEAEMIRAERLKGDPFVVLHRILDEIIQGDPALERRVRAWKWFASYSFPMAIVPVRGVKMYVSNDHVSAICKSAVYVYRNSEARLIALQAVATTKEALRSLFGTLNGNGGAKKKRLRLFFTDRREGGTITLYPLQAASKRRYRSTFVPLPDGTGWLATFVHVAALPAEMETDNEGYAYLLIEKGLSPEEERRRILRLLNARLPFPFPEAWADAQSPQARKFWEKVKDMVVDVNVTIPVLSKGDGFKDYSVGVDVGNIRAWREIITSMNQ